MIDMTAVKNADPELYAAMDAELKRQQGNIELIASENIVSPAVLAAAGSHLTNKYAEGLPGKRYYGGCEFVDRAENLARDRLKELFGCGYCKPSPAPDRRSRQAAPGQREDRLPERRSRCSPESIPGSFQTSPSFPFASAWERPENRKGKESNR